MAFRDSRPPARSPRPTRWAASTGVAASAVLAACTPYVAAPVAPGAFVAALDARRLDEKPAGEAWSGAELLTAALRRNPAVSAAQAKYQAARAAVAVAKAYQGAGLSLTAEYAKESPHWGYGAGADLPLDVGARRSTRVGTADLQALQAFYDYGEAIWTVRTALARARADLIAARAEVALADEVADLRRERLSRLERRVAAGEDDRTLSLTAQADLAVAERRVAEAHGRRTQATAALAKALGVGPAAVADLRFAPDSAAPALDGLPGWRRDATAFRSDVLRAIADYDLAENALRLEVAKQYPEVRLSPSYFYDHGVGKFPFNLNLVLPPFDLNRSGIGQAEAARAAAGRSLEAVQAAALAAVDTAAAATVSARASRERVAHRELPAALRAAQGAARALSAGEADRVDDLGARAAERESRLNLLEGQRVEANAVADLEDALRRAFDPAEAQILQGAITPPPGAKP